MKNLQEIMNEMSNLSEQIAVTLNDEEIVVAPDMEVAPSPATLLAAAPACVAVNRSVPFCAAVNLPGNFVPVTPIIPRILYDLSCLKCIVENCTTNVTVNGTTCPVTLFNVKVVGCIPFIVNVPLVSSPGVGGTCVVPFPNTLSACANGSVCVDNVICTKCNEADAVAACEIVKTKFNCDCVTVTFNPANPTKVDCAVTVKGTFTLPNCNARVPGNCNPT